MYDVENVNRNNNLPENRHSFFDRIKINFSEQESVTDKKSAEACYEVFCVDGDVGTIDHLLMTTNPEQFADDLAKRLSHHPSEVSICIAGGWDAFQQSKELGPRLISALQSRGFKVGQIDDKSKNDIGDNFSRIGTIHKDKVVIKRRRVYIDVGVASGGEEESITLVFSK